MSNKKNLRILLTGVAVKFHGTVKDVQCSLTAGKRALYFLFLLGILFSRTTKDELYFKVQYDAAMYDTHARMHVT